MISCDNLCVPTGFNNYYFREYQTEANGYTDGLCFGAAMVWSTEVFKEIASDPLCVDFTRKKLSTFYYHNSHIQQTYLNTCIAHPQRSAQFARVLNQQDKKTVMDSGYNHLCTRQHDQVISTRIQYRDVNLMSEPENVISLWKKT